MVGELWYGSELRARRTRRESRVIEPSEKRFLTDDLPNLPKLRESSQDGCDFCRFLRDIILSEETRDRLRFEFETDISSLRASAIEIRISFKWDHRDVNDHSVNNYLIVDVKFGSEFRCHYWNSLNAVEGHEDIAERYGLIQSSNQFYSDTETVQWLKNCIAACEKHGHSGLKSDYLPDRLLDVTEGKVRLVPHETLKALNSKDHPAYAALSYCWGTSEDAQVQLKTTRASFAERQAGISIEDLSAVSALHDAVKMTRKLSIPYLWVDCLCILQDDISDWERNCTHMDKVYGCAKVTLVAAASKSCRQGFLQKKGQRLLLPLRSMTDPSLKGLVQFQHKFVLAGTVGIPSDSYADFRNTLLSRRGWAVQERILAARQIVFGPCNVHFRCSHRQRARGAPSDVQLSHTLSVGELHNEQVPRPYDTWSSVVREFRYITAKSFTNPTDLLPALSGLATSFNRLLKDEYCAGHWKKDLAMSLLWYRPSLSSTVPRPSLQAHLQAHRSPVPYLLPSWSQLCKGGTSSFEMNSHTRTPQRFSRSIEARYLDWEKRLLRRDPMGALASANLKIRTRVMKSPSTKDLLMLFPPLVKVHQREDSESQKLSALDPETSAEAGSGALTVHLDYKSTRADLP